MSKGLLITGATGKQGGSTIDALVSSPANSSDYTILAVTRNANSSSAKELLAKSDKIKIVQGDLNDVPGLFNAANATHSNIWGVFSVQVPAGKGQTTETEQTQGKALVDEALKAGVKQFVYSSVDRGGDKSYDNPTNIPHFISKHNIEHHLIDKAKGTDISYTILRPTAFMENWAPGMFGKMFGAMWTASLPQDRKLQLISTADIGHFAAQALTKPEAYRNRVISLAGDELSFAEATKIFRDKTGSPAPATYSFLGSGMLWGIKEMGTMFSWFRDEGYGANISELKKEHPGLLTLGDWIEKKSAFAKK